MVSDFFTGRPADSHVPQHSGHATGPAVPVAANLLTELTSRHAASASRMSLPDANLQSARYFIVKVPTVNSMALACRDNKWMLNRAQSLTINQFLNGTPAARDAASAAGAKVAPMFLFFSVFNSKHFQAVARISDAVPVELLSAPPSPQDLYPLPLTFCRTLSLPLMDCMPLRNPMAGQAPVPMNGNWSELPPLLGKAVMLLSYEAPGVDVDTSAVRDLWVVDPPLNIPEDVGMGAPPGAVAAAAAAISAAEAASAASAGGAASTGPSAAVASQRVQSVPGSGSAPIARGDPSTKPAGGAVAALPPPNTPADMAHRIALAFAGEGGFLFEGDTTSVKEGMQRGLVGGPRAMGPDVKRHVLPGTGVLLLDASNGTMIGLLRATSGPGEYVRGALHCRMTGCDGGAPVQVQMQPWLSCPPAKHSVYSHAFQRRPTAGPLTKRIMYDVAVALLRYVPPPVLAEKAEGLLSGPIPAGASAPGAPPAAASGRVATTATYGAARRGASQEGGPRQGGGERRGYSGRGDRGGGRPGGRDRY